MSNELKRLNIAVIVVGFSILMILFFASSDVRAFIDKTNYTDSGLISSGKDKYYSFTEGKYGAAYSINVNSSMPLDIYVVPSLKQYDFFKKQDSFNMYGGCEAYQVKFFSTTCHVGNYIGIILSNQAGSGFTNTTAQFAIKIKEL
ncbi:MAG TPA: hypothetical protein VK431_06795 [Nitrosopumilaceae archaeon]|nr:hypothetical protein [Nitrosopumilaceae archaeon]